MMSLFTRSHAHTLMRSWGPGSRTLLTGASDGTARLWDASSGRPLRSIAFPAALVDAALAGGRVVGCVLGRTPAVVGLADGSVRFARPPRSAPGCPVRAHLLRPPCFD